MTIREAYENLHDIYSVAVYFKDNDELYKYSDLAYDFDDYGVDEFLISGTARLAILMVHTPHNSVIDNFKSDFDNKLNEVSTYLYKKYCKGNKCDSCPLRTGTQSCYPSQASDCMAALALVSSMLEKHKPE